VQEIIIRKTIKGDAEQVVKLSNAVVRSAYAHIMPQEIFDFNDANINEKIERIKKQEFNINGNINLVAVDCDKDKITAFANAKTLSNYEYYSNLGYADLWSIYIASEYQRQGLGKKLFDNTASELKKQGCLKMIIGVLKENLQARKAYEKWGGRLDAHEKFYEKMGYKFPEVFYIFDIQ